MKSIDRAQKLIAQKDLKKLDDLWTEMVLDEHVDIVAFFEIAETLKKSDEAAHALVLLEMLASHLESEKEIQKAIQVYKHMLYYTKDDTKMRKKLTSLYKTLYHESTHVNDYIEISGIDKTEPIFKAIRKLEEFLKYDVGQYFYFERYGLGEIIDTIPVRREIVINFEKKERHFLTLDIARGLLTPIDSEHFLYKKHKNIAELKDLASADPFALIKLLLKSFAQPLTAAQIKGYVDGVVEKKALSKVWEKVRKRLEKDDNVKVSGRTMKTYAYSESTVDKQEEAITAFEKAPTHEKYLLAEYYAKKMPAFFKQIEPRLTELGNNVYKKEPAVALGIALLFDDLKIEGNLSYTLDDIFAHTKPEKIITKLNNVDHQKILLHVIKEKNPHEWPDILETVFFSTGDIKLLDEVVQHLHHSPQKLKNIYYAVFSVPKQFPQQFQWMLKKIQSGDLQEYRSPRFIPKLIDSLDYIKGIKATMSNILSLETFDAILHEAEEDEARRILESIARSQTLLEYEKKDFSRIIEYYFPHFFGKEEKTIYTTESALLKKKDELHRIMTIEIPENKKEISRAREYGDLSENFEYKAARERQDQLYQKVRTLEAALKKVTVIDPKTIDTSRVTVGARVTLKSVQRGEHIHYTILGRWDTDLEKNIISSEAPVARSLLGKVRGDRVTLHNNEYEIVEIEKGL
ncbi:MAG: GreA/GreB family elongation factor [candidate division WOR-3 bacterium]|nr:MAG: GreA/GreB family elongation factor [candidate division WOR-3 bacterium]